MANKAIASIGLSWDELGRISHDLRVFIPADDYQKADALSLSAALLVSGQLGVLSPRYSLDLCSHALDFLDLQPHEPEVIQFPLSKARIELIQQESTIVSTFHPDFLQGGTMEPEEAVRRLLTNYLYHVNATVIPELAGYLRSIVLGTVYYYLSVVLSKELRQRSFSTDVASSQLNMSMIEFSYSIYPQWQGGPTLPSERFRSQMIESRKQLASIQNRIR